MVVFTGQLVNAIVPAATGGGGWTPQKVESVVESIKSLFKMAMEVKNGGQSIGNDDSRIIQDRSEPRIVQTQAPKCKVEAGLENLHALCQMMIQQGHGSDKLTSLFDLNALTINDAAQFIKKVLS